MPTGPNMSDLAGMSTSGLIEELGKYRRYAAGPTSAHLRERFTNQAVAYEAELRRRGKDPDALGLLGVVAPPPCRFRPLADHVVVLPDVVADVTEGGIIVPDSAKEKPRQGTVLAVGPGRTEPGIGTIVPAVTVGDVVIFGLYSGISIDLDGQAVLIMREEDVLGVLTSPVTE